MTDAYCGLCDGDHEPRDCPATRRIQESERVAERPDLSTRDGAEEFLDD
jgi:hypothetical protein